MPVLEDGLGPRGTKDDGDDTPSGSAAGAGEDIWRGATFRATEMPTPHRDQPGHPAGQRTLRIQDSVSDSDRRS